MMQVSKRARVVKDFTNIHVQRNYMDNLYYKLNLNSMEDWTNVRKSKITDYGRKKTIIESYAHNWEKLFTRIYPNYPWKFGKYFNYAVHKFFKSKVNQIEFMENLYDKLQLSSIEGWLNVTRRKIIDNGGYSLIVKHYSNDMKKLLKNIYPNFPWNFQSLKLKSKFEFFSYFENQKNFMDELFRKLKLNNLNDWIKISKKTIIQNGGKILISFYYSNDKKKLLLNIYPDHNWNFDELKLSSNYFELIENQKKFIENLFIKLKLNHLNDWLNISIDKIRKNGGKKLLEKYYQNDMTKLLKKIYPDHNWQFDQLKIYSNDYFKSIENQKNFMDKFYKKNNFNSLEELIININKSKIIKNGGFSLIKYYYENNLINLLLNIYPNYPWKFDEFEYKLNNNFFNSINNQKKFLNQLFNKLKLNSLHDWLFISKKLIRKNGGKKLLILYSNDIKKLLIKIYPNHHWNLTKKEIKKERKKIDHQRHQMNILFNHFKLNSLEDWLKISKMKLIKNGAKKLLSLFDFDFKKLLLIIYPDHNWNFNNIKYKKNNNFYQSFEFNQEKLKYLQKKYQIEKKNDWYRLPYKIEQINIYKGLKLIFPTEKWIKKNFQTKLKKISQRNLFISLKIIYKNYFLIENYRNNFHIGNLEFDIFIPSLNFAFEYQGEQHFDEVFNSFAQIDLFKYRDKYKEKISLEKNIKLISVPFWWDLSIRSLISSISLQINHYNNNNNYYYLNNINNNDNDNYNANNNEDILNNNNDNLNIDNLNNNSVEK